jgi:hypothetical protein
LGYFILWNDNGHWLEWTIDNARAGDHKVFLRYATMYESPRQLSVNGQVVKGLESFTMPLTGGWRYWVESPLSAPITLKEGKNVIRITSIGGRGLNLTSIRLVGPGDDSTLIPAVGFSGQGGGKVTTITHSRRGSFYYWNDEGHWLEWAIADASPGRYAVTLRYATKTRSPREMRVNGQVAEGLGSFTLTPTGDWKTWKDGTLPATVALKEGRNVIRLTSLGGGGLNLDEIRLTRAR